MSHRAATAVLELCITGVHGGGELRFGSRAVLATQALLPADDDDENDNDDDDKGNEAAVLGRTMHRVREVPWDSDGGNDPLRWRAKPLADTCSLWRALYPLK